MSRYKLRIDGPEGKLEIVINDPGPKRRGIALIAHPHPLHGGSLDNKVVQTVSDTLFELGYVAVRPNFRGVGQSEGTYDHGKGEAEDMLATANFVLPKYPDLPLVLAGFSFGAFIMCQVCHALAPRHVILIGPAVNLFEFGSVPQRVTIIHGEKDELVPLRGVQTWAESYHADMIIVPEADHFFHRKLTHLKRALIEQCPL